MLLFYIALTFVRSSIHIACLHVGASVLRSRTLWLTIRASLNDLSSISFVLRVCIVISYLILQYLLVSKYLAVRRQKATETTAKTFDVLRASLLLVAC